MFQADTLQNTTRSFKARRGSHDLQKPVVPFVGINYFEVCIAKVLRQLNLLRYGIEDVV